MSEILFILTVIYVAYVVYKVSSDSKTEARSNKSSHVETIMTPSGSIPVTEAVAVVETEEKVAEVAAAPVSSSNLRDPDTGEVAKVTNNYRSLKRWLKEALVAEGLLDKVYSNSELNDETNAKIKDALDAIKFMSKYHA